MVVSKGLLKRRPTLHSGRGRKRILQEFGIKGRLIASTWQKTRFSHTDLDYLNFKVLSKLVCHGAGLNVCKSP